MLRVEPPDSRVPIGGHGREDPEALGMELRYALLDNSLLFKRELVVCIIGLLVCLFVCFYALLLNYGCLNTSTGALVV